ncbi:hypothetical protein FLONG3_5392 [Fusarium longipes]|uniref:SH3 domain-containing protein n=1 Tax=Fusarium longipes TaxID=694270 RepID=A0A395SVK9_9HYPO|nr:hypothetical protein FLONG3_5392 [Fusarium longipes]
MAAPFKVKAIYEYSSPHEDDLNFNIGQVITVTDEEDADWYGGEYVDDQGVKQEGIFPRNFVEKFEPTAPPRPARTRTKKEPESAQPIEDIASPPPPPVQQAPPPVPAPEPEPEIEEAHEPIQKHAAPEPAAPAIPEPAPSKPAEPAPSAAPQPPSAPKAAEPPAPAPAAASPKPKPSGPPPVSQKPSSFKDRIAAFNKPAAPPVAPFKPSGLAGSGTGFIKKPFVAPPPSRNAFIPPPQQTPTAKVYRRDEDPEIKEREAETQGQAERAGLVPTETQGGESEDQPKPTSLKERIALLQKQQQEQAARHADAAAKKEKPKRPQKKRESVGHVEGPVETEASPQEPPTPLEHKETQDTEVRTSTDEPRTNRMPPPPRRKSSKGPAAEPTHDGNEADMSGAGDTTEGIDELTEREDSDGTSKVAPRAPTLPIHAGPPPETPKQESDEGDEEEEEEEEDDVDPEVRRREELRARMAKMSGGMGFHGMFGAPMPAPAPPPKKKKAPKPERTSIDESIGEASPTSQGAPPVPAMMPLPGFGGPSKPEEPAHPETEHESATRAPPPPVPSQLPRAPEAAVAPNEEEEDNDATPAPHSAPTIPPREPAGAPPVPGSRGAPPPVPSDSRPPPPAPPADVKSQSDGSESGDELSGGRDSEGETPTLVAKSPPMPPPPVQPPHLPSRSPPLSPTRDEFSPTSPKSNASNRLSRPPPPIPGSAPAPPTQSRPPPPPPPGGPRRQSTQDFQVQPRGPPQAGEEEAEELTEYEGDYDTDIASSVPHKDALKSHARDSSQEDSTLMSPVSDAPANIPPPVPSAAAPRAVPPPVPSQPPPENKRQSVDIPRAAPPPPPPTDKRPSVDVPRGAPPPPPPANFLPPQPPQSPHPDEDYDPYNYSAPPGGHAYAPRTPKIEEDVAFPPSPSVTSPVAGRPPPPAVPGRTSNRQSLDISRAAAGNRRSVDMHRPSMSMESGFIANDMDLAIQSGWWKQSNQVPPVLQGRKDIYFEAEESTSTNGGQQTTITREISVLYQDYSQTSLTVRYDPYDPSDVQLDQRHEPPPRPLRQDQMEEYYERFGRQISTAVASKKDSVVADGTPQGLVLELLKPYKDVLPPVGTRAYGALVYSNMANASTQQNDMIRAGDIITIRNAKFQGKHGPMHAKYSAEVGKPDHVAVVAEWDGTKKKVRAWEQGRESKKVKVESFKLDDLRSGEVKIWRVMPRSWVGWNSQS